jgi:hypothetical protein
LDNVWAKDIKRYCIRSKMLKFIKLAIVSSVAFLYVANAAAQSVEPNSTDYIYCNSKNLKSLKRSVNKSAALCKRGNNRDKEVKKINSQIQKAQKKLNRPPKNQTSAEKADLEKQLSELIKTLEIAKTNQAAEREKLCSASTVLATKYKEHNNFCTANFPRKIDKARCGKGSFRNESPSGVVIQCVLKNLVLVGNACRVFTENFFDNDRSMQQSIDAFFRSTDNNIRLEYTGVNQGVYQMNYSTIKTTNVTECGGK